MTKHTKEPWEVGATGDGKPSSETHTESNEQRMVFHPDEDDMDSIPF